MKTIKEWFEKNREKWNLYQKEWRLKNKTKVSKYNKTYKKNFIKKLEAKILLKLVKTPEVQLDKIYK